MERRTIRHTIATFVITAAATIGPSSPATSGPAPTGDPHAAARPAVPVDTDPHVQLTRPHRLTSGIADVIVRIRGGEMCTGTPITGTTAVITAAHCILDADGEVSGPRTVVRDGVEYTAVSVLLDPAYHDAAGPALDGAVLMMDREIPGPSASLAEVFSPHEAVTLAGFQPIDTDGSLLRGTRFDDRPLPQGASGGVVRIEVAPAGCIHEAPQLVVMATQVKVPCGLIPGASGGGLYVEDDGKTVLLGVISTVAFDLSYNGVVPLAALHHLLENPSMYTRAMTADTVRHSTPTVRRS